MIPTYHCARFLRQTLESVLAQDPGPEMMQIEVVDDGSTLDDPAAVVAAVGQGRVMFHRQPQNVGHTKNFETCLRRARGKIVHLLHGDDYVLDGFYRKLQIAFESQPEIGAAFCRQIFMDDSGNWEAYSPLEQAESGILNNALECLALEQKIMTPAIVVRREAYERLGGFDSRLICSEDWEMWVRIAAFGPVWFEPTPLAWYRQHEQNETSRLRAGGAYYQDIVKAIEHVQRHLPRELRAAAGQGLAGFAADLFIGITYTFAMIRLGRTYAANGTSLPHNASPSSSHSTAGPVTSSSCIARVSRLMNS